MELAWSLLMLAPIAAPPKVLAAQIDGDRSIHLTMAHVEQGAGGRVRQSRRTLCGLQPAIVIRGLPSSQPEDERCLACYARIDAYGFTLDV